MIRVSIVDRVPHRVFNGVSRYMLGITELAQPQHFGVDLRVLHWGRQRSAQRWRQYFEPFEPPRRLVQLNDHLLRPWGQWLSGADVVHYPYHYLPANWTCGPAAKVVTVHGASAYASELSDPERGARIKAGLQSGLRSSLRSGLKSGLKSNGQGLQRVITVSEWSKLELIKHFDLSAHSIEVIPLGVDLHHFRRLDNARELLNRQWPELSDNLPYILHLGPCEKRKNMLRLIEAFALLKQRSGLPHKLLLAGREGSLTDEFNKRIRQLHIADDVLQLGPVDDALLPALYSAAELFFFPSLYEGFGIPILEAMACETPVVTSNVTAMPEVGGDAVLQVDPADVGAMADACERLLTDAGLHRQLQVRGLERVQGFSWEKCATRHLDLYKRVAAERGSSEG